MTKILIETLVDTDVLIADLDELLLPGSDKIDIGTYFNIEMLSYSTDLQTALVDNKIAIKYNGKTITDIAQLNDVDADWTYSDNYSEKTISNGIKSLAFSEFVVPYDSLLEICNVRCEVSRGSFNLLIQKSATNGSEWQTIATCQCFGAPASTDLSGIRINDNELIRAVIEKTVNTSIKGPAFTLIANKLIGD